MTTPRIQAARAVMEKLRTLVDDARDYSILRKVGGQISVADAAILVAAWEEMEARTERAESGVEVMARTVDRQRLEIGQLANKKTELERTVMQLHLRADELQRRLS